MKIILFIIILLILDHLNTFSQTQVELKFQSRLPFIEDVDDLEIYNSRLYIKSNNDLIVGDIVSDFSVHIHPDYLTINVIIDICNKDSILLVTTDQELIIFSLSDTRLPIEIGRIEQDKLSSIFICEENIYIVYNKDRFFQLNLENPNTPSFIQNSIIFENTNITWIEGFEDILYVATSDSGIFSLDISNFLDPIIVSRINSDLTYKKLLKNDDILIALFEDILYNCEYGNEKYDTGLILYSISEPNIPIKISEYRISPGGGEDIALSNPYLYFLSGYYSLGDLVYATNCIYSIDLTNPANPILLDSLSIEAFTYNNDYWPQMMIWDRDYLWIAQWDGIVQVNTTNPNSLIQSREIDYGGFARNIDVDSIFIGVTDDYFGLHILDRSIPEQSKLIASFSEITDWGDVKIRDGFVYATSRAGGFHIYDLKEIPHEISHLPLPGSGFKIFLKDTLAFIGDGPAGLTIVNTKDPLTPNIIGQLELENRIIYNVQVQDNYAYVTFDRFLSIPGFGVIDISNPSYPILVYTSPNFPDYVKGLFVDNNRLYVQGDYTEIKVYDIAEPLNPKFLTQIDMGTYQNWDIFVENNLLYSIRGGIYDISDLTNPIKLCDMPGTSMGMVKSNQYLYIARGFLGIYSYFLDITSDINIQNGVEINTFNLSQNYPNPFNASTIIKFFLPKVSKVTLKLYNLLGEEVETIINNELTIGEHKLTWDSKHFPSGLYFYQLKTEDFTETKKFIIQK